MRSLQVLAETGLDQLVDLAGFPNLVQLGAILTLLAVVGLVVLVSMRRGIRDLRTDVADVVGHIPAGGAQPQLAAPLGGAGLPPPPVAALGPAPVGLNEPVQAPPALPAAPAGPPVGEPPVPFSALIAEPAPPRPAPPAAPAPLAAPAPAPTPAGGVPAVAPALALPEGPPPRRAASAVEEAIPQAINTAARREISLVGRALKILDELEQSETDPDKLFALFALDNLMARMRRGAETQMILAGRDPERAIRDPLSVSDVVRTASSQIEHYERIRIALDWDPMIRAYAVVPLAHLVAELLENATEFSPEGAAVEVGATSHRGDVVLTVADTGVGMSPQELAAVNRIVKEGPSAEDLARGRLGVAVVARLAARLGAGVSFAPGQGEGARGCTAIVRVPAKLVDDRPEAEPRAPRTQGAPLLPPQPTLEPSEATAPPPTAEAFQPVRLAQRGGGELPKRGDTPDRPPRSAAPAASTPATPAPPEAPAPAAAPAPAVPAPAAPAVTPAPPTPTAPAGPSTSGGRLPTRGAPPRPREATVDAPVGKIPTAATPADPTDRPGGMGIVPLGARFTPLGEGANPSSVLPRHSADGQALHDRTGATAPPVIRPPGPAGPGTQFPFGGAPAGPAQPAGHRARPTARPGAAAPPAGDLPALSEALATGERPIGSDAPMARRPATARRPLVARPLEAFPPVPSAPGAIAPNVTVPPGLIPPIGAAPPLSRPGVPQAAHRTAQPAPAVAVGPAAGPAAPVGGFAPAQPPSGPAAPPGSPTFTPGGAPAFPAPGSIPGPGIPPGQPSPGAASPDGASPGPSGRTGFAAPAIITPGPALGLPPIPGDLGAAPGFPGGGPGAAPGVQDVRSGPSGPVLPTRAPVGPTGPLPMSGDGRTASSTGRPTGGFSPGGTMQPGGGGDAALAIPDLNSSIAGSAIALRATIQEEALAELAGLNTYKPEKTESRPASSLARRQSGASSVPAVAEPAKVPPKARDADKIRSALSAFQLGTRRGRSGSRAPAGKG